MIDLKEYFNNPINQKVIDDYIVKIELEKEIKEERLTKFHLKMKNKTVFVNFVEKVIAKYKSNDYIERYINRGIQPEEALFYFLFEYAEKYGRKCNENEWKLYGNDFTSQLFFINGYYFNWMNGQGSIIKVMKSNIPFTIT
jgi:hypothetical protein